MSDHDILIKVSGQLDLISQLLTNHLHHHFLYTLTMLGALMSAATAFGLLFLKRRLYGRKDK